MCMYIWTCVFGVLSISTALHKHFDKTIQLTAEGNLTFFFNLIFLNICYVPSNMPVSYKPVQWVLFYRWVNYFTNHTTNACAETWTQVHLAHSLSLHGLSSPLLRMLPVEGFSRSPCVCHPLKAPKVLLLPETSLSPALRVLPLGEVLDPAALTHADSQGLTLSIPSGSVFTDITLGAWNWPRAEYLLHRCCQCFLFGKAVVKDSAAQQTPSSFKLST